MIVLFMLMLHYTRVVYLVHKIISQNEIGYVNVDGTCEHVFICCDSEINTGGNAGKPGWNLWMILIESYSDLYDWTYFISVAGEFNLSSNDLRRHYLHTSDVLRFLYLQRCRLSVILKLILFVNKYIDSFLLQKITIEEKKNKEQRRVKYWEIKRLF